MRIPLDIPAGLNGDDTTLAAKGRWRAGSLVRFRNGRAQTDGGWESLTSDLLTGVCRTVFPWDDNGAILNIAFGTHSKLQLWQGGVLYDITPFGPPKRLTANPITVVGGSATITLHEPAHGRTTADSLRMFGSTSVGRKSLDGTYSITVVDADSWRFTFGSNAVVARTLGGNPLSVTIGDDTVTVTESAHNIADGTSVVFSGAAAVGGITPNGTFPITVVDANTYSFTFTSPATSTATGGGASVVATVPTTGGGANVVVTPQSLLPAGATDGTGSVGYGTGGYDRGPWGQSSSTVDFFPRTWSFGAWGQNLIGSPRAGGIYAWTNNTASKAVAIDGAPTQCTQILVAPLAGGYQLFALGTQEEVSGTFNPMCIRHSSVRDNTQWSSTAAESTAREYILPGGGNIIAGRMVGPYMFVWTTDALFLGTFLGALNQPWRFDRIGRNCGLIGPNACVVVGQAAFWASPDRKFYRCAIGGAPAPLDCPILKEFADNLAAAQGDKVVASSCAEFSEVRWDYPDSRDGFENSRFVRLVVVGQDIGAWSQGMLARTAYVDAGPSLYPIATTYAGQVYYHERGQSADGVAFSWFIETADQVLDLDWRMLVSEVWPDFKDQVGPITVTLTATETPQGLETVYTALPMAPGDAKADALISGRMFRVKFSGSGASTAARIGAPVFEARQAGKL